MSTPTASQLAHWLANTGTLLEQCEWKGQPIRLDRWQRAFFADGARGQSITKSRQVGGSLALAGRAFTRAMILPFAETVFVSYTQAEAARLVRYARAFWETCPPDFRRPLVTDSATVLEWKDARGWARLTAKASKNFRGESNADAVIDEFAFVPDDDVVFAGAVPLLVHGTAQLTCASTAYGARGLHHEIATNFEQRYGAFSRLRVPWFASAFLSTDPKSAAAWMRQNPTASIEETIAAWGNVAARTQWDLMGHNEDRWREEFCCEYLSGRAAVLSRESLLTVSDDYSPADDVHALPRPMGVVFAGWDVGATKDRSELVMFELDGSDHARLIYRRTLPTGMPLQDQQDWLAAQLDAYPVHQLRGDATGMGRQMMFTLANTERFRGRVIPLVVTPEVKQEAVEGFRGRVQAKRVTLPMDRDLHSQLASIRRKVTASGRLVYETPSTKHGHADAAWACLYGAPRLDALAHDDGAVSVRIIGGAEDFTSTYVDQRKLERLYDSDFFSDDDLVRRLRQYGARTDDEAEAHVRAIEREVAMREHEDEHGSRPKMAEAS